MESYQLRSEIVSSGGKYYIQTNLLPDRQRVVTSLFHEGQLLSTQNDAVDPSLPVDALRSRVRALHEDHKIRITSLLDVRQRLQKDVDGRAHLKLGHALYLEKLYKEAMAEVIRAVKLGLEQSQAYSILGNCLLAQGEHEKALKSFQKGIEISPEYPDLHNDLGRTYLKLDRCREAVQEFDKALELNRYYQDAFLNMAVALARNVVLKQDYDLSRDLHTRMKHIMGMCLQLKPALDNEDFREAMAGVDREDYELVHRKLLAIQEEEERIAGSDLSLEIYLILKFRSEDLNEADIDRLIDRVRTAMEVNPEYPDLQNDLGLLYAAKCKLFIDKANECFATALELNRNFKKAEKNQRLASNDRQGIHFLLRALLD
jgi:tetratricopeptide (TPR) repeat protein